MVGLAGSEGLRLPARAASLRRDTGDRGQDRGAAKGALESDDRIAKGVVQVRQIETEGSAEGTVTEEDPETEIDPGGPVGSRKDRATSLGTRLGKLRVGSPPFNGRPWPRQGMGMAEEPAPRPSLRP